MAVPFAEYAAATAFTRAVDGASLTNRVHRRRAIRWAVAGGGWVDRWGGGGGGVRGGVLALSRRGGVGGGGGWLTPTHGGAPGLVPHPARKVRFLRGKGGGGVGFRIFSRCFPSVWGEV